MSVHLCEVFNNQTNLCYVKIRVHDKVTIAYTSSSTFLCRQVHDMTCSWFLLEDGAGRCITIVCAIHPHHLSLWNSLYRATVTSAWLPHELWIIPREKHWAKKLLGPAARYV